MRVVLQRVSEAKVDVGGQTIGKIGRGFLLLVAVGKHDTPGDIRWLAKKVAGLRVFEDAEGKMNLPLDAVNGACLAVSQFTLYGDCRKGFRPGFTDAAPAEAGQQGFEAFVAALRETGVHVETGRFQAHMHVSLVNDGPVTLILERENDH